MAIYIFLTISIVLAAWLGWRTGFTRTFFAVLAGFLAIFIASRYPYQEGINSYLVFAMTALFVIIVGGFTLRLISFFYLNILDKLGGAVLSVCIWLIVSVNIIIPTVIYGNHASGGTSHTIYETVSRIMQSKIPVFKDYVPRLLERKIMERQK